MELLGKWLTIRGYVMFEITGDPARLERGKEFVVGGLASGKLKPRHCQDVSFFSRSSKRTAILESNQQIGKIVVTL